MKRPLFLRTDARKYSRLGVRRKNKQVYRKPKGGENKIRLNKKGHWRKVKVGFKNFNPDRYKVDNFFPIIVYNISDLSKITKSHVGIIGKIGMKKKLAIVQHAEKHNIKLGNVSMQKYVKKSEEKIHERKNVRKKILDKRKSKKEIKKEKAEEKKTEKKEETKTEIKNEAKDHEHKHTEHKHENKQMENKG